MCSKSLKEGSELQVARPQPPATIWNHASAEPPDPHIKCSTRLSRSALPSWERSNLGPEWEVGMGDPGLLQQGLLGTVQ